MGIVNFLSEKINLSIFLRMDVALEHSSDIVKVGVDAIC